MAGYSELIKNFDKIRDFTRDMFIYGNKGRNDYSMSPRKYDDERRRIESYLSDYINQNRDRHEKYISISSDTAARTVNPLFKLFTTKSFTKRDCNLHFILLDILRDGRKMTVTEITAEAEIYTTSFAEAEPPEPMTIRNKLNEYAGLGILASEKDRRKLTYYLPRNPLSCLSPETMQALQTALAYYKNITPPGILAHTLYLPRPIPSPFIYRHIYFAQALDDDKLLRLLTAISQKRTVTLEMVPARARSPLKTEAVPLRILTNTRTGRRYVSIYSLNKGKYTNYRLDYIKNITINNPFEQFNEIRKRHEDMLDNTFAIVHQIYNRLHHVKMILRIDESKEGFILERLAREGRHGTVTKVGKDTFEYYIEIPDTTEMLPWLRTFIGRIIDIQGSEKNVIALFKKDIYTMAEMYGLTGTESKGREENE